MKFAFFDLETTGTSPAFDHPLQFAAILTDADFREIEGVNLRCRLAPYVIPSPQALAVTGVRPHQLIDPELPSLFEFAQEVTEIVSRWSPAIWTGYNNIRFDDEMLRQLFYQNLQPEIFATQFNGNTRFDIMTVLFAVFQRHRARFNWPVDETGKVRLKLDRLAPENGFVGHNAHDALGDVEATIHIARLIAQRAPDVWGQMLANRDKRHVRALLERFEPLELVRRFRGDPPKAIMGCLCGYSNRNPNLAYFFDLDAADPKRLVTASDEELKIAMDGEPRLLHSISVNKVPSLLPPETVTEEQRRRAHTLADVTELKQRLVAAMSARYPTITDAEPQHVERQIFDGFYGRKDKARLGEFQGADWRRRQEIVASFDDARLRQLGRRLLAFYAPELLSEQEKHQYSEWRCDRWFAPADAKAEWMTFEKAHHAISDMRASGPYDPATLQEIEGFINCFSAKAEQQSRF